MVKRTLRSISPTHTLAPTTRQTQARCTLLNIRLHRVQLLPHPQAARSGSPRPTWNERPGSAGRAA
jgi:hypothetical protein